MKKAIEIATRTLPFPPLPFQPLEPLLASSVVVPIMKGTVRGRRKPLRRPRSALLSGKQRAEVEEAKGNRMPRRQRRRKAAQRLRKSLQAMQVPSHPLTVPSGSVPMQQLTGTLTQVHDTTPKLVLFLFTSHCPNSSC